MAWYKTQESSSWHWEDAKYRNQKTTIDGILFDSRKEAQRYCELKMLEKAGRIRDLRRQVKYILIPVQREAPDPHAKVPVRGKIIERECSYIADFVYEDAVTGATVVEDTKGLRTKDYIIKRKLMLYTFGIRILEV